MVKFGENNKKKCNFTKVETSALTRTSLMQSEKYTIIVIKGVFPNYMDEIAQDWLCLVITL